MDKFCFAKLGRSNRVCLLFAQRGSIIEKLMYLILIQVKFGFNYGEFSIVMVPKLPILNFNHV
jgi:hypothetical protein